MGYSTSALARSPPARYRCDSVPIRIPHSSPSRGVRSYAQLILSVPRQPRLHIFDGRVYFRTGSRIEENELRPTPEYPAVPLLLEYAGNDRKGWGHNRSRDIRVLWRWNEARREWDELARILTQGTEWFHHLAPLVRRELAEQNAGRPPVSPGEVGRTVTARVLAFLDAEMSPLDDAERSHVMSSLHDQFTARLVQEAIAA